MMDINCNCSAVVMKSMGDETKIRAKVLIVRDSSVYAVCKGCNTEVRIPLKMEEVDSPPLFLNKY